MVEFFDGLTHQEQQDYLRKAQVYRRRFISALLTGLVKKVLAKKASPEQRIQPRAPHAPYAAE